ncbi:DUF4381 domain-containing protein [Methylobacterium planeticum]|uniref:DUF4381 domain-containing protein n=1 Tax=Methylobacterium planeticum TaxID=2615211 RepID=A0A6N6MQQ6_9HYPH|nr:DUF4381 domain-containing protein [Methylobacterium planeticum]KAB1072483.1 DUF4381 domain-containing protein [Methylobacterium planeticum]
MADDPGNLANLRDLAVPDPVAFWPPAPGAWFVLAGLGAMLAMSLRDVLSRHYADAYRRAAMAELDRIAASLGPDASAVDRISEVMKRAALVAFPRDEVAPLSGAGWADFVARTGGAKLDAGAVRRLLLEAYDTRHPDAGEVRNLIAQARIWVSEHRRPAEAGRS